MIKTYDCKFCKYQTEIKTNYKAHTETLKHRDNIRKRTIKCEYCTNDVDKLQIDSHNLACDNKILVDKIVLAKISDTVNVIKTNLETEYATKLSKLMDAHRAELIKVSRKSSNALTYQNRDHKKEIEKLKQQYQTELSCAKQQYQTDLSCIKQEHKENIDDYKKELFAVNIKLDTANAKLDNVKDKQIETIEQSKIFVTEAKEKELARMETVLKACGKITEKSVDGICNALTFANTEFTTAPILKKICKFDFVDDCKCVDDLIHHHEENTIHEYIGDIIVMLYKKDKAGDQSFWNTDASRLGYIIRQKVDAKILWGKDANADRIASFVIEPIIEFFIECVDSRKDAENKFIKKNNDCPKHSKMYDRIQKKEAVCKSLIFIKSSLLDIKLSKNIIKYITPKFNINVQMTLAKGN
jgi:hypothetical protein